MRSDPGYLTVTFGKNDRSFSNFYEFLSIRNIYTLLPNSNVLQKPILRLICHELITSSSKGIKILG